MTRQITEGDIPGERYTYLAEGGSMMFGDADGTMTFAVSNGYGDGIFPCYVFDGRYLDVDPEVRNWFGSYRACFRGKTQVYGCDYADPSKATEDDLVLEGDWFVYTREGTVFITRM